MERQSPSINQQISNYIKLIEQLFENKQLDEFVQRVQKYILPHYERCHHSGKYKEKVIEHVQNGQSNQMNKQDIKQNKIQTHKAQQPHKQQQQPQKQQQHYQNLTHKQQQQITHDKQQPIKQQQNLYLVDSNELENLKQIQNQLQQINKIDERKDIQKRQQQHVLQDDQQAKQQGHQLQQQQQQPKPEQQKQPKQHHLLVVKQQISAKQKQSPSKTNQALLKQIIQQKQKPVLNESLSQQIKAAVKQSKIHILQKYDEMKLVLFKIEREMKKLQTPMTENKQWKVNKINATSSIGVKTKGTLVEIRYQGIVLTNIFNLCVMIYLSQLYKEWVPFCSGSKTITQPSPLQKIVLMDLKIPFLTQRYAYLHGIAIDRITKNGKLYIYAEGITHQKQLLLHVHKADKGEYEKKVAKSVVLDAKYMVCEIGNEGNGKYSVKVYGMLDSHMPMLPQKVVNYIVKQLGGMIFDKIVKRAKDIKNTAWQKQLKANEKRQQKNKFYEWLNQRINNWDKSQTLRKSKI